MTITAKEVSTVAGYVLDSTPQTIEISEGDEVQTLYFYNEPEGGVEFTKVSAADKTERIPDTTFEIRKVSDDTLIGSAPDITRHFIELRGIGIVDVKSMFGVQSVRETQNIDLVITLEDWSREKARV